MAEFPGAINYFVDRRRVFAGINTKRAIVIHSTGGNAAQTVEQLGDWFRTNDVGVSSHYGIGRDGRIAQYVLEGDGAATNCCLLGAYDPFWDQFGRANLNHHTLTVELINDQRNSLAPTEPQKQTLFRLVKYWVEKYDIPLSNIKSHASIDQINRQSCPGPKFPWAELFDHLKGGSTVQPFDIRSADFNHYFIESDATHWTCKRTGCVIMFGNLALFRTLSTDGNALPVIGLPRTPELYQSEDGYSWSVQFFERGLIVYDKEHKKDGQPGMGDCYLGKYEQFKEYDPEYKADHIVEKIPEEVYQLVKKLSASPVVLLAEEIRALDKRVGI